MRLRGPLATIGALGIAVLAAGVFAVWTGIARAQAIRAMAVSSTIIVDPGIHETFASPPSDPAPAMTAQEALDAFERKHVSIPDYVTVQLGLLTLPVGPDCGPECEHNNIVQGDMVYTVLNKLVYGFSRRVCPAASHRPDWQCTQWDFIDANTGIYIAGLMPAQCGCAAPGLGRHGLVTGFFLMVGGPPPGVSVRLPGRVIATSTTGRRFTVAVRYRGRFQLRLPPGTYQLTGYSPRVRANNAEMRCVASHPVRLRAGQSKRRNVYCSVP